MHRASATRRRFLQLSLAAVGALRSPGHVSADPATLTISQPADADSLDPHRTSSVLAAERLFNLYDTLVTLDFDLRGITGGLADSWDVAPDGKTYRFRLRADVRFHGGKLLTARDVKLTFDRWRDPAVASPTRYRLADVIDVTASDDRTVVLRLRRPSNVLLFHLASPFASILNLEAVTRAGADYGTVTVDGTGPFTYREWILRERFVVDRNPAYTWGPPIFRNAGPAKIEHVVWRIVREGDPSSLAPGSDGIDVTRWSSFQDAKRDVHDPYLRVVRYRVGYTVYLGFNLARPPVDDLRVRRAINHAVNKEEIIQDVFGGFGSPAFGPLAPIVPYALRDPRAGYAYSPALARRLLDEAGWKLAPDGVRQRGGKSLRLPILAIAGYGYPRMLALLEQQLRLVGVVVDPILVEEPVIWGRLKAGEHVVFAMGMPHSNADELLGFYFDSRQRPSPNCFGFVDPRVDELLDQSRMEPSREQRERLYGEIQRRVIDSAVWVPLWHPERVMVMTTRVKGLRPHPVYDVGYHKLLDVSLAR